MCYGFLATMVVVFKCNPSEGRPDPVATRKLPIFMALFFNVSWSIVAFGHGYVARGQDSHTVPAFSHSISVPSALPVPTDR